MSLTDRAKLAFSIHPTTSFCSFMAKDWKKTRLDLARLYAKGVRPAEIERKLNVSHTFVVKWIGRLKQHGTVDPLPRSGRPATVTPPIKKRIRALSKGKQKRSTRKVARLVAAESRVPVSHETVRQTVRKLQLYPHRRIPKPRLSQVHRQARVRFAKKYKRYSPQRLLSIDEKIFTLVPAGNRKNDIVWDTKGIKYYSDRSGSLFKSTSSEGSPRPARRHSLSSTNRSLPTSTSTSSNTT